MSDHRRKKVNACRHDSDRLLSLGAAIALDRALQSVGMREHDRSYTTNEFGKPAFADRPELHFNLSHSGTYVLCALSDAPVGCDVQEIKPMKHDIPRRFFHPDEAAAIAAVPESEREALFYRYWAMKEACIKAAGKGLHLPLNAFCVDLSSRSVEVDGCEYYLTEINPATGYSAALCACIPDAPEITIL